MLSGVKCPFCDHEMDPGIIDGAGIRGWKTFVPVVWRPTDPMKRRGGDRRQPPGFFRQRAAHSCAACGALVLAPDLW